LDGIFVTQHTDGAIAAFEFKDRNNQSSSFAATWKGKSTRNTVLSPVTLQVFNRTLVSWETLATENSVGADTMFTLTGSKGVDLSDYYDAQGWIACRVYQRIE